MTRDLLQPENKVNGEHGPSSEAEEGDDATGISADTSNESPTSDERVGSTTSTKLSGGRSSPTSSAKSRSSIPDPVVYEPPERRKSANLSIASKPEEDSDDPVATTTHEGNGVDESAVDDSVTTSDADPKTTEDPEPEQDGDETEEPEAEAPTPQEVDSTSEEIVEEASNEDGSCSPGKVSRTSGHFATSEEASATNVQDEEKETVATDEGTNEDDTAVENPAADDVSLQNTETEIPGTESENEVPTETEPNPTVNSGESVEPPEDAKEQGDDNDPVETTTEQEEKPEESAAQSEPTEEEAKSDDHENRSVAEVEEKSTYPGVVIVTCSRPASEVSDKQDTSQSPIAEPDQAEHKEELLNPDDNQEEEAGATEDDEPELEKASVTPTSAEEASDETRIEISIPAPPTVPEESIAAEEEDIEVEEPTEDNDETSSADHKETETEVPQDDKPQDDEPQEDEPKEDEPQEDEPKEDELQEDEPKEDGCDAEESPTVQSQPEQEDPTCDEEATAAAEEVASEPEEVQAENATEDDLVTAPSDDHDHASDNEEPAATTAETPTTDELPTPIECDESKNSSSSFEVSSPSKQIKRPNSPKRLPKAMTSPRKKNGVMLSPTKTPDGRKLPPIKAPVGLAPNPNLKNIKSKIGSFDNIKYKPGGGDKKVISMKLEWKATPKIGSLDRGEKRKDRSGDESKDEQQPEESSEQETAIDSPEKIDEEPGPISA